MPSPLHRPTALARRSATAPTRTSSAATAGRLVAAVAVGAAGVVLVPGAVSAHERTRTTEPAAVAPLDACPVSGPSTYGDSWGDRRSGGRRHEGVDMEADRGTPVLAVRDGDAEFKRSNLGGNAIWLISAAGERFYYAHLDEFEGGSRLVRAGEVIGYVGRSGNAKGDHLHFETRAGDRAVNPYPYVLAACAPESLLAASPVANRPLLR